MNNRNERLDVNSSVRRNAPRRAPYDKDQGELMTRNLVFLCGFVLVILYLELVFRIARGGSVFNRSFAYAVMFSFSAGLLLSILCSFFSEKVNYILTLIVISFLGVYYCVQLVYCNFFQTAFCWAQLASAGDATQFIGNTMTEIFKALPVIILLLAPAILYGIFGRKQIRVGSMNWTVRIVGAILCVLFFVGGVGFVNTHPDPLDDKYYYSSAFSMDESMNRFGVLTAMRLDTKNILGLYKYEEISVDTMPDPVNPSGTSAEPAETTLPAVVTSEDGTRFISFIDPIYTEIEHTYEVKKGADGKLYVDAEDKTGKPVTVKLKENADGSLTVDGYDPFAVDTSPNVMDIDFESLIAKSSGTLQKAHTWFSQRTPTNKNAYTGMFEGKNLIFITVESWAPAAINPTLTPTLYKMKTEGFVFDNYYCSLWGGSTATGEYANITGNFYNNSNCLKKSGSTLEKFTLGNVLSASGYDCYAFHNWTATYYSRDISHPNFGYKYYGTVYQAKGNYPGTKGWDVSFSRAWPLSDFELANNTLSYISADKPFHLYYMTVSGHPYQTFGGNSQANKHRIDVNAANLPYTETNALSFVASQYEVELMVARLCEELEAKGVLQDTVFVMAPDHFPYQISEDKEANIRTLAQLYNLSTDNIYSNPDLYKAPLIIWSPSMKRPIEVKKVCSAIDILPTVLNLFGAEYDSRLIIGHDILSDCDGFVPLNMSNADANVSSSNNWISDYGVYISGSKVFTPTAGSGFDGTKTQQYIDYGCATLANMRTYSFYILENNYYAKVFPKG